jgi:hypothetical protein
MQNIFFRNMIGLVLTAMFLTACLADGKYKYSRKKEKEELCMLKMENDYLMKKLDSVYGPEIPSLNDRLSRSRSRGILAPLATNLVAEATSLVKTVITNEENKFTTVSKFTKTGLYFYDQPSVSGPFDPVGMQFSGFELLRTIRDGSGHTDTAFVAEFVLDTTRSAEIMNNSIFKLKLKDFRLKYVKPKVALASRKKMSVEFDISFLTAYVNDKGSIFDSVILGKFHLLLKDVSIDLSDPNFGHCAKDTAAPEVNGQSFIVPRSFGYFKTGSKLISGYNQGLYTIIASVKECTKPLFGTRLSTDGSTVLLNTTSADLSSEAGKIKK